jgi:hypothetical protein
MRKNRNSKLWEYLEAAGVLENGTDEEIKAAKRAYRKKYFLEYKQKQRQIKPEYVVNFSKENGEHARILEAAKRHNTSATDFIHSASLAYIEQRFIVPDRMQVAMLEQLLSECLNEIKTLVKSKERFFYSREDKIDAVERRIVKLESQINEVFRNPPLIHDHQNQVA